MSRPPAAEPSEAVVRDAIATIARRYPEVRAVIAHGSWVRGGDFWPGQSDLDLIVATAPETPREIELRIQSEWKILLSRTLHLDVEPFVLTEGDLEAWRMARSIKPAVQTMAVQLDIAGFEVVDRHILLWSLTGRDPLAGFPVLRGAHLQDEAVARVRQLLEYDFVRWGDEQANRIACDALKAATLFFLVKAGRPPTRDKGEVFQLFLTVVPDFPHRRETADRIWELYRAGNTAGGPQHRKACHEFVRELLNLVDPALVST